MHITCFQIIVVPHHYCGFTRWFPFLNLKNKFVFWSNNTILGANNISASKIARNARATDARARCLLDFIKFRGIGGLPRMRCIRAIDGGVLKSASSGIGCSASLVYVSFGIDLGSLDKNHPTVHFLAKYCRSIESGHIVEWPLGV